MALSSRHTAEFIPGIVQLQAAVAGASASTATRLRYQNARLVAASAGASATTGRLGLPRALAASEIAASGATGLYGADFQFQIGVAASAAVSATLTLHIHHHLAATVAAAGGVIPTLRKNYFYLVPTTTGTLTLTPLAAGVLTLVPVTD